MFDFRGLVHVLVEHDVQFVIVGGLAGVLQGAPLNTRDLDILYALDDSNATKLLAALSELEAVFRGDPRKLRPSLSHLRSQGHKLLSTKKGDLDCLGTITGSLRCVTASRHLQTAQVSAYRHSASLR